MSAQEGKFGEEARKMAQTQVPLAIPLSWTVLLPQLEKNLGDAMKELEAL